MRGSSAVAGTANVQKPIRFVTNDDEEPLSKRRRIGAACRTCQKRKTKCSGERPECKTCLESENECLGYPEQNQTTTKGSKTGWSRQRRERNKSSAKTVDGTRRSRGSRRLSDQYALPSGDALPMSADDASNSATISVPVHEDERTEAALAGASQHGPAPMHDHSEAGAPRRNRVPYFRYFGPTAIGGPGFKQMVVEVSHQQEASNLDDHPPMSTESISASRRSPDVSRRRSTPSSSNLPFYIRGDRGPVSPLIKDLCETFFTHLGCNYPFLTPSTFMRDLEEKQIDSILVDSMCAIAARFSKHSSLVDAGRTAKRDQQCTDLTHKSKYGSVFARRAMLALTEVFPCPTLAAVQACLLLAYEQFGSDHDSGLWVYLGLAIRMAQDLGIQKLEGLQYEGYLGPTPKTAKNGAAGKMEEQRRAEDFARMRASCTNNTEQEKEQRRAEKERVNTFWAVFFLDRVVSSGTGRPVSLRDKDIAISFPPSDETDDTNDWPAPFPALIRIVHLYGRIANLLNNIREVHQVTAPMLKQLVAAEDDLIGIYQRLSPKLHFSAANFQHYLQHSQATNFVLLHFWFHTLIVLLHQPTLLHSFDGSIQKLFPNSQELSLSSAKTIADILSFAELLDSKSFIGNPFTSQPMYIAACAFLLESATHSSSRPQSRAGSSLSLPLSPVKATMVASVTPVLQDHHTRSAIDHIKTSTRGDKKEAAKLNLLAAAASHNYQRCYQALKALETYWSGTRYILTVLDQKAKGSLDPLLYTAEDLEGAAELHGPVALPASPAWARLGEQSSGSISSGHRAHLKRLTSAAHPSSKASNSSMKIDSDQAIGWSLTGDTNSSDSSLSVLYQTAREEAAPRMPTIAGESRSTLQGMSLQDSGAGFDASSSGLPSRSQPPSNFAPPFYGNPTSAPGAVQHHQSPERSSDMLSYPPQGYMSTDGSAISNQDAQVLHAQASSRPRRLSHGSQHSSRADALEQQVNHMTNSPAYLHQQHPTDAAFDHAGPGPPVNASGPGAYANMIIESQNIDTSALGLDPLLWLDYMPQDVLDYLGSQDDGSIVGTDASPGGVNAPL